jgi:hypothetical protein
MRNIKYILLLSLSLFFIGCQGFLDIEPKGQVTPNSVEELGQLIIGNSVFSSGHSNNIFMSDEFYITDDTYESLAKTLNKNAYLWMPLFGEGEDDNNWNNFYKQIYPANYVLSLIDDSELGGANEVDRKRIKAEALTIRAMAYLQLVNLYGPHYNENTAENDMSVPLLLIPDIKPELPRSSVKDIYDQILIDLLAAEKLFSSNEVPRVRINSSKNAVYGILSRVYLYQGNWEESLKYSNKMLTNYDVLYDYNDYTKEDAYLVKELSGLNNIESVLFRSSSQKYTESNMQVKLVQDLVDLFEEGDLRFTYFTEKDTVDGGYEYLGFDHNPLVGIQTPEIYLNKAEALVHLDQKDDAMDVLNLLRQKRFSPANYTELTALTNEEAMQNVLDERRREMMFTGLRWFDLKRLNLVDAYKTTITRIVNGQTYILEPNSDQYVIDIAPKIKELNSKL